MKGDDGVSQFMSNIVGNRAVCDKLCRDVLAEKLSHALILEGVRGSGKHAIAKNLTAAIACTDRNSSKGFPCGECIGCRKALNGLSPDVITVGCEDKATVGIDVVRFLKEDIHVVPNDLDFKTYIIEDADKMTVPAQNAFLLTLEEPPAYVHFILLCENASLLLETIRSRAPVLRTEPVTNEELEEHICSIDRRAAQMRLSSPREFSELIVASGNGIGTALEYLDPKKFAPIKEARAIAIEFCDIAISGGGARKAFPLIARFPDKREALIDQLSMISSALTDLIMLKKSDNAPLSFFSDRDRAFELCDSASVSFLYNLNNAVLSAVDNTQRKANLRLVLIKLLSDSSIL